MTVRNYKELIVWQKAMEVAEQAYRLVKLLPKEETYALSDQIRRSAISIPSNIAEGQARNSSKEFMKFLSIAKGSAAELETQLLLAVRIGYFKDPDILPTIDLIVEVTKIINTLHSKLTTNNYPLITNHYPL